MLHHINPVDFFWFHEPSPAATSLRCNAPMLPRVIQATPKDEDNHLRTFQYIFDTQAYSIVDAQPSVIFRICECLSIVKGGPEPLETEIHEILASKREVRSSDFQTLFLNWYKKRVRWFFVPASAMDLGHMVVVLKWCIRILIVDLGMGMVVITIIIDSLFCILLFSVFCFVFPFPPCFLFLFLFLESNECVRG